MAKTKSRRDFLKQASAGAAALTTFSTQNSLAAAPIAHENLAAPPAARVLGANDRLNVGFVGCGGRMNTHIDYVVRRAKEKATCNPWPSVTFTTVANNWRASVQA